MSKAVLREGFEKEHFPIVRRETEKYLVECACQKEVNNILELGTGLGYSGFVMLESNKDAKLLTVEKNTENFNRAKTLFFDSGYENRVQIINDSAENVVLNLIHSNQIKPEQSKFFDLIFLDCAKSRYIEMIDSLIDLLKPGGKIFADNVLFMGMVNSSEPVNHKHRTIVKNLRKFIEFCKNSDKLIDTKLYDIEDGFLITKKRMV